MATIVNTPSNNDPGNSLGLVLGLLALAVLAYLFFVYGIPAIRGGTQTNPQEIDVNVTQQPQPTSSGNGGNTQLEQNFNLDGNPVEPTDGLLPTSSNTQPTGGSVTSPIPTE